MKTVHLKIFLICSIIPCMWFGGEYYAKWKKKKIFQQVRDAGGCVYNRGEFYNESLSILGSDREAIPALRILLDHSIPEELSFEDDSLVIERLQAENKPGVPYRKAISDKSLRYVGQMKWLKELYLAGNQIGDSGLKHLSDLKNLRRLNLNSTKVTDDGLKSLEKLHSLEYVSVISTLITADGLEWLMNRIPSLNNEEMQEQLMKKQARERKTF